MSPVATADAPYIANREKREGFDAIVGHEDADAIVGFVVFGKMGSHLGKSVCGGTATTDGDGCGGENEVFDSRGIETEFVGRVDRERAKKLVDGVLNEVEHNALLADSRHNFSRNGMIFVMIGRTNCHVGSFDEAFDFEERVASFKADGFGFSVESENDATIVFGVADDDNRTVGQLGASGNLARSEETVAVDMDKHLNLQFEEFDWPRARNGGEIDATRKE